jgi:hypothetical protein
LPKRNILIVESYVTIAGAIVNELGEPLNPPGSLTGIPLDKLRELGLLDREAA